MRDSGSVLRSFKVYVSEVLPDYEVRLSSEEGAFARPFARVAWTTPITVIPHGARVTECRRTLQVVCWPQESDTPDEARIVAENVVEALFVGFMQGIHEASMARDRGRAHPLRVPIYDFTGKGPYDEVTEDDRDPRDHASIPEQPNVGDIEDPDTDLSRIVIADIRVRWMRGVDVAITGPPAYTVGAKPVFP